METWTPGCPWWFHTLLCLFNIMSMSHHLFLGLFFFEWPPIASIYERHFLSLSDISILTTFLFNDFAFYLIQTILFFCRIPYNFPNGDFICFIPVADTTYSIFEGDLFNFVYYILNSNLRKGIGMSYFKNSFLTTTLKYPNHLIEFGRWLSLILENISNFFQILLLLQHFRVILSFL